MDITIRITSCHIIAGLFAALISAGLSLGWFGFKNDLLAFFVAVFILYIVGQFAQKIAGDEISGWMIRCCRWLTRRHKAGTGTGSR